MYKAIRVFQKIQTERRSQLSKLTTKFVDAIMETVDTIPKQMLQNVLNCYHTILNLKKKGASCQICYIQEGNYKILGDNYLYNDEPQRKLAEFFKANYSWIEIEGDFKVDFTKMAVRVILRFNVELSNSDFKDYEIVASVKDDKNMYPILDMINADLQSIHCITDKWNINYFQYDYSTKAPTNGTLEVYIPIEMKK